MVQSVCANLEIPHIQVSWRSTMSYNTQTVINFYPDPELLAVGLATIVKNLHWNNYAILYQDNDSLIRLQEILKIPQLGDTPVIIRQIDSNDDYR